MNDIDFDRDGYTNTFPFMLQQEMTKQAADLQGIQRFNSVDEYLQLMMLVRGGEKPFRTGVRNSFGFTSFPKFMMDFFRHRRQYDPVGRFMEEAGKAAGKYYKYDAANEALLAYHTLRFIKNGESIYKLAPHKADFLSQLKLDIPGGLLFCPHKEFMISIPRGCVQTGFGDLVNVFVSEDDFDRSAYDDPNYITDSGVEYALTFTDVTKVIRCVGVFVDGSGSRTAYFQMPVSAGTSINDLFDGMLRRSPEQYRESVYQVFKIVLNTCAYLGIKDADVQKQMGIKYTASSNPKKEKQSERKNRLYGYDHFVVGRIYDERCRANGGGGGSGSPILKRFRVRAHIRAQWYGPRTDEKPGTEQRLIMIEEFEKGDDLGVELSPKTTVLV